MRDSIQRLEEVKDRVVDYLNLQKGMDESTRRMWIIDVKDAYYNVVAAWQMLDAVGRGKREYADSCNNFLETAKMSLGLSASELRSFNEKNASGLESELKTSFDKCWNEISSEVEPFLEKKKTKKSATRVIKINDEEYQLPCSVCSEISVVFKTGISEYGEQQKSLIYKGIIYSTSYKLDHAEKIFVLLGEGKISEVHSYLKEHLKMEGIDAYCPDCDRIYCSKHYDIIEEYDEGSYDCTYGTCPNGHERVIHD